jgi:hypothetical protein
LREYEKENSQDLTIKVVDYKYVSKPSFDNYREEAVDDTGSNKIAEDIKKQLLYEWATQQNIPYIKRFPVRYEEYKTESEFWIPIFSTSQGFEESKVILEISSNQFNASRIKVIGVNFSILQEMYILD